MNIHPSYFLKRNCQILFLCIAAALVGSCGSGGGDDTATTSTPSGAVNPPSNPSPVTPPVNPPGQPSPAPETPPPPAATLAVNDAMAGTPIAASTKVYTLTKVSIPSVDLAGSTVQFISSSNAATLLIPDADSPGQFWLPITFAPASGDIVVKKEGATIASLPVTLVPFATSGVPGEATKNFLQSSLFTTNQKITTLTAARQSPDLVEALQAVRDAETGQLAWVTEVMNNGSAVIAYNNDGTPVTATVNDLNMLDQMVLYTAQLAVNGGKLPAVATLSPLGRLFDFLVPSAYAQAASCIPNRSLAGIPEEKRQSVANDIAWCQAMVQTANEEAFANNLRAVGEGMKFAGNAALALSTLGGSFVVQGAFVVASEVLNSAGTFATNYGNAVAIISSLKDGNFSEAGKKTLEAVGDEVLSKAVKGWAALGIDKLNLKFDLMAKTLTTFTSKIAKTGIKNKLRDLIAGFKSRNQGNSLCPDGTIPVTNPADGIGHCP